MNPGGKAALAVGAGYVIGRQHKLRAVLMLGAAAATGRMIGSQGAGQQNGDSDSAGAGLLGKVGDAGRSAAIGAFGRAADRIGERLSEMATAMRGGADDGNGAKQPPTETAETDEPPASEEVDESEGAKAAA
jgi:hypothetical protein